MILSEAWKLTCGGFVLLLLLGLCGCGALVGYMSEGDPNKVWPDSYYYVGVRTDAKLWEVWKHSPAPIVSKMVTFPAIAIDFPLSFAVDTAFLPLLLCNSAGRAILGLDKSNAFEGGSDNFPDRVPGSTKYDTLEDERN